LLNGADKSRKRVLSIDFVTHDGVVANSELIGAQVYWYIPINSTMLSYNQQDLNSLSKNPFLSGATITEEVDGTKIEINSDH
jgi:hypothetical protein